MDEAVRSREEKSDPRLMRVRLNDRQLAPVYRKDDAGKRVFIHWAARVSLGLLRLAHRLSRRVLQLHEGPKLVQRQPCLTAFWFSTRRHFLHCGITNTWFV